MAMQDQNSRPQRFNAPHEFAYCLARAFHAVSTPAWVRSFLSTISAGLVVLLMMGASVGSALQFGRSGTNGQGLGESRQQQQQPQPIPSPDNGVSPNLSPRQKQDLLKSNFERMKKDMDVLLDLAKSLQKDLDGSNQNVLSLKVVDKADRIEKLAKKIKNTARGY
jgi:hypothetical protein